MGHMTKRSDAFTNALKNQEPEVIFAKADEFNDAFRKFHLSHTLHNNGRSIKRRKGKIECQCILSGHFNQEKICLRESLNLKQNGHTRC